MGGGGGGSSRKNQFIWALPKIGGLDSLLI